MNGVYGAEVVLTGVKRSIRRWTYLSATSLTTITTWPGLESNMSPPLTAGE